VLKYGKKYEKTILVKRNKHSIFKLLKGDVYWFFPGKTLPCYQCYKLVTLKNLGAVSLTYLSILKEGFTPVFSATLSNGKSVSP